MPGRKMIFVILGLLLILPLAACQTDKPPVENPPVQPENDTGWKWKNLGFENRSVDGVQVRNDGKVFAQLESRLYFREGDQWHAVGPDVDVSTFCVIDKESGTTVVIAGNDGKVYLLSMQDNSWNEVSIPTNPHPVNIIATSPSTGDIYVGQSSKNEGGLWKSSDGGITWNKLTDITVRGIAVHPENPEILYIVDKLTYLSTDGGKNWTKMETGANYGAMIHPLYPDTAYLAFSQGVVSSNHDGTITSQQRFYLPGGMTCLKFNPASLNEWALGIWDYPSGVGGLYYTFNGGAHWLEIGEQVKDTRILALSYDKDGKILYMGTSGNGLWALNTERLKEE